MIAIVHRRGAALALKLQQRSLLQHGTIVARLKGKYLVDCGHFLPAPAEYAQRHSKIQPNGGL